MSKEKEKQNNENNKNAQDENKKDQGQQQDEKKQDESSEEKNDLQEMLEELEEKDQDELLENIQELKKENKELKQKVNDLSEYEEIAKRSQSQYVSLKKEFESYQKRVEKQKEENKDQELIEIMEKILPIIDNLRTSVENIPEDIQDHDWIEGVKLSYKNIKEKLNELGVHAIDSVGQLPHHDYHEPISKQKVNDEEKDGKIIKEYQRWYVYEKDEDEKNVIRPAKVIVGKLEDDDE